jgi:hypothetical protein
MIGSTILIALLCVGYFAADAWVVSSPARCFSSRPLVVEHQRPTTTTTSLAAGFGGDSKIKKDKLKPKHQWDRYTTNLKKADKVKVAVRVEGTEEWLQVGNVKSEDNAFSEIAVWRQRALIADVSTVYSTEVYGGNAIPDAVNFAGQKGTKIILVKRKKITVISRFSFTIPFLSTQADYFLQKSLTRIKLSGVTVN